MLVTLLLCFVVFIKYNVIECFEVNSKEIVTLQQYYSTKYVEFNYGEHYDFVILQAHSQYRNNTLSSQQYTEYGKSYESLHSGIIKRKQNNFNNDMVTYVKSSDFDNVQALLMAVSVPRNHPIPGGCCLTCGLENDPNLHVSYDRYKTMLRFQRASKYYSSRASPDCDQSEKPATYDLVYSVYCMYLNEDDYGEENLFNSLYEMSTPEGIKSQGTLLTTLDSKATLFVELETAFAQGIVFNVIVTDRSSGSVLETAYVPTALYACNFTSSNNSPDNCNAKGSTTVLVFCMVFGVLGFILSIAGFKLFRLYVFSCGTGFYWFLFFIIMSRYLSSAYENPNGTLVVSFMLAILGGGFTLFLYAFTKSFYFIVVPTLCLFYGFFLSSILFYTPFGQLEIWHIDYQFILGFSSISLLFSFIGLFHPKAMCYMSSSMMGSYALIMIPNYFFRANMQYIILTVVNHVIIPKFGYLYLHRIYSTNEYILSGAWAVAFLLGFIVQYCTTKDQKFYYSGKELRAKVYVKLTQSINLGKEKKQKKKGRPTADHIRPVTPREYQRSPQPQERTPLLFSEMLDDYESMEPQHHGGYGGFDQTRNPNNDNSRLQPNTHQPLLHHQQQPPPLIVHHQEAFIIPGGPSSSSLVNEAPPPYEYNSQMSNTLNNQNVSNHFANSTEISQASVNSAPSLLYDDDEKNAAYQPSDDRYPKMF